MITANAKRARVGGTAAMNFRADRGSQYAIAHCPNSAISEAAEATAAVCTCIVAPGHDAGSKHESNAIALNANQKSTTGARTIVSAVEISGAAYHPALESGG